MPVDPLLESLLGGFAQEAREIGDELGRALLALESTGLSPENVNQESARVARQIHTLKGSAATLGLDDVALIAHRMEDGFAPARKAGTAPEPALVDWLLKTLDLALVRVRAHADGKGESLPPVESLPLEPPPAEAEELSEQTPAPATPRPSPAREDTDDDDARAQWRVDAGQVVALMRDAERLREVRLRVDQRRRELDKAFEQLGRFGVAPETAEARMRMLAVSRSMRGDAEEIGEVIESLEESVKSISTVPLRTVLDSLQRAVRELCRATGKRAQLALVGAELSLDRRILSALKPALIQLVRNAVDHGIEVPAERGRRGKHADGAIVIRVEQQGSTVFLEVSDDGAGIDPEAIRQAARKKGLLGPAELDALDDAQVRQLIFRSGLSTAGQVSETSGRGVGLDVVRAKVQGLKGSIEVLGAPGQGTRFLLNVPTELGGSPVLVVRCGEHQVGLPLLAVEAIIPASADRIHVSGHQMTVDHEGRPLRLEDLGERLGLRQAEVPRERRPLLITQFQGDWVALAVDEVIGDRDLVIRPLPTELRDLAAYQGAAMLARGELIPVIRADWLVKGTAAADAPSSQRVLVVDDSLTARAIHRSILEAGGFTVHAVSSGRQALDQLRRSGYDAIVADISMAGMDGLELTRAIRAHANATATPVVLVSARGDLRAEALASGADGYLSKADCAAGRLLAEIATVIARRRGTA